MTPKEVYIVKFSNLNSDAQPSDQDAANQLGRHCIRQIISQTSSASYPATGNQKKKKIYFEKINYQSPRKRSDETACPSPCAEVV